MYKPKFKTRYIVFIFLKNHSESFYQGCSVTRATTTTGNPPRRAYQGRMMTLPHSSRALVWQCLAKYDIFSTTGVSQRSMQDQESASDIQPTEDHAHLNVQARMIAQEDNLNKQIYFRPLQMSCFIRQPNHHPHQLQRLSLQQHLGLSLFRYYFD